MKINLRLLYLYLFAFVGLLIVIVGSVRLVDLGLKTVVFKDADKYEYVVPGKTLDGTDVDPEVEKARMEREFVRNRQREFSGAISMILVGLPVYAYHWRTIQREKK